MSAGLFLRAAVVQLVAVAALSAVLGLALPHGFFEDWGWLVGPAAWLTCAALTALMLRLPTGPTLLGAALAGIPSALAVVRRRPLARGRGRRRPLRDLVREAAGAGHRVDRLMRPTRMKLPALPWGARVRQNHSRHGLLRR